MEYTSFIFNMVIGFVCGLLGLLHLFDVKKELVSKTGIIGLGCGIVGFIFSFVYVVLNGLVYTTVDTGIPKINSDGAFAEKTNAADVFKCLYYDNPNYHEIYAKFSDLIQKQYNYNKDLKADYLTREYIDCQDSSEIGNCALHEHILEGQQKPYDGTKSCKYLYAPYAGDSVTNKDKSDRFLTALILSLIVCLANIGLAIFGFLLFRTPGEF